MKKQAQEGICMKKRRQANKVGNRKVYVDENGRYVLYGGQKSKEERAAQRKNKAAVYTDRKKQQKKYSCRNKNQDD